MAVVHLHRNKVRVQAFSYPLSLRELRSKLAAIRGQVSRLSTARLLAVAATTAAITAAQSAATHAQKVALTKIKLGCHSTAASVALMVTSARRRAVLRVTTQASAVKLSRHVFQVLSVTVNLQKSSIAFSANTERSKIRLMI